MARLFKQKTTFYVDPNGKRCEPTDPGAIKVCKESAKYYGEYRDADNVLRRDPLSANRTAAQTMLANRLKSAERGRSGMGTRFDEFLMMPLVSHVAAYKDVLESRQLSRVHVTNSIRHLKELLKGCRFRFWKDLQPSRVEVWLSGQVKNGRGLATLNHVLQSAKAFCNWLVEDARAPSNPLGILRRFNADTDRRRVRRSLTAAELQTLLVTTSRSTVILYGFDGEARSMLYLAAGFTGLRASELASLTPRSFDFDAGTVTIEAAHSKNRRKDTLPLHQELVVRLSAWLQTRSAATLRIDGNGPLWPGSWAARRVGARMIRQDLKAAGIEVEVNGQRIDFHALRTTFVTLLARAGVSLATAQRLARHSTPELTAKNYTRLELQDLAGSVGLLASPIIGGNVPDISISR